MSGLESYVLEVIVSDVQLTTKQYDKKPRFVGVSEGGGLMSIESSPPFKTEVVDLDGPIDPSTGDVVVRLKAFKLPPIDVVEDRSRETDLERRERKEIEKQESHVKFERSDSSASTQTLFESVFPHNPTIKKKFKKGKSFFFNMNHQNLISLMQEKDSLIAQMYRDNIDRSCVGLAKLHVPRSFFAAICKAHQSSVLRNYISCYGPLFVDSNLHKNALKRRRMEFKCPYTKDENPYSSEKLSKMEPYIRFRDIYKVPSMPEPCPFCDGQSGCGCNLSQMPIKCRSTNNDAKPRFLPGGLDPEELMEPSPGMIEPEKLPICAQTEERVIFYMEGDKEKACATIFIRLTCFGNALNTLKYPEEQDSTYMSIPYENE